MHRREFLLGAGALLAAAALAPRRARADEAFELPAATREELERSPYVYVSPLHSDGKESRCHAEVWFFFYEGDVVLVTGRERWKARAMLRGWDRARIWVGDYGRVRSDGEGFRKGPSFLARARQENDPAVFEALLQAFGKKYPEEWGKWEPRFRKGVGDGSRVLIRYEPQAA